MLEILTKNGWESLANRKEYHTVYEYDGIQTLSFDISPDDEMYQYIANETPVRNSENRYLVKSIDKRKTTCTITCDLDMDEWFQNQPYISTKDIEKFKTKSLLSILDAIKPNGWTIINAGIRSIKRTIELENATNYDILMKCQEIFGVTYEINNLKRQINVIDPDAVIDKGIYITPQLNLSSMTMKGTSTDFATRITAYGKQSDDGTFVNFAAINNGKNYVEDNTYANKANPIWIVWKDERYTVPENLLDAAKKKLKEQAYPALSFEVTVNDLAESDDSYSFLKMGLYDFVHVIVDSNIEIIERVIKLQKYHDAPDKNKITLSNKPETITNRLNQAISEVSENLSNMKGSILEQAQQKATQLINAWAEKGHVYMTENEIYILDKEPKEQAKYCIRINLGGIGFSQNGWQGPYISAWTIDGKFNADFITAGTIQGIKLIGNEIIGGKITGETTISVGTDLHVGNNIYLGNQKLRETKKIIFSETSFIELSDWFLNLQSGDGKIHFTSDSINIGFGDFILLGAFKSTEQVFIFGNVVVPNKLTVDKLQVDDEVVFMCKTSINNNVVIGGDLGVNGAVTIGKDLGVIRDMTVGGDLRVVGNKNRIVETNNYGMRKLNAVESASCFFTDEGQIMIEANGKATINFDPIWLETVNTEKPYHIHLTPYCDVCPWIIEEHKDYCVIGGKPNTNVNWHVSALQRGYENIRLEEHQERRCLMWI